MNEKHLEVKGLYLEYPPTVLSEYICGKCSLGALFDHLCRRNRR